MSKKKGVSYWDKKLWTEFSKYIRQRDAGYDGWVTCITCPEYRHWKEMDAGHFVTRNAKAVKYDERNVHAQCKSCNGFHEGKAYLYGKEIDRRYGKGTADELEAQRHVTVQRKAYELEEMYKKYRELNNGK